MKYWFDVPPTLEELAELEQIVMGSEHGRCHPQPTWSVIDVPLWREFPTAGNFTAHYRTTGYEPFFLKAIRIYLEAAEHGTTDRTYLVGLSDG